MESERRLQVDVAHTAVTQVLATLIAIGNGVVLARCLGPSGRGDLSVLLLVRAVMDMALSGGLGSASAFLLAEAGLQRVCATLTVHGALAALTAMALVGASIASGVAAWLLPGIPTWAVVLAIAPLPASTLAGSFKGLFLGSGQMRRVNRLNLIEIILTLASNAGLVLFLGLGLAGALASSLVASVTVAILCGLHLRCARISLRPRWDPPLLGKLLSFGAAAQAANLAQFLSYRADLFLVNILTNSRGAGLYAVATTLAETLWYLPNAAASVVFARSLDRGARAGFGLPPMVLRICIGSAVLTGLVLALFGPTLISILYSESFAGAYEPLLALLPGAVSLSAAKVLAAEIAGRGHPRWNAAASLLGLAITLGFDLALIPRFGTVGAAVASSVAYFVVTLATIAAYARLTGRAR